MCSNKDNSSFLVFQSHHLKCSYKFYFHCIFIIYLILFYVIDSICLTKKTLFLHNFYVMQPLFWLSTIEQESQQSASRGRVLAFYRIAPCLRWRHREKSSCLVEMNIHALRLIIGENDPWFSFSNRFFFVVEILNQRQLIKYA